MGFHVLRAGGTLCMMVFMLALGMPGRQSGTDEAMLHAVEAPANGLWLETLGLDTISQGYGEPQAGKSVDGHPLTLKGEVYPHGIGTHAAGSYTIRLKGAATRFLARVGVDDERATSGSVTFEVWVDDRKAADTGVMHGGDTPQTLSVDLTGAKKLMLVVGDAGDGIANDHADWAGALLLLKPDAAERPEAARVAVEPPRLIVPPTLPEPRIHGPRVVGATPGRPFLFLIPATGEGPLTYGARHLPKGLALDPRTGLITGSLAQPGRTRVLLTAAGPHGRAFRGLTIVGGEHQLALTPPLGWNSWNVWATAVDTGKVKAAADAMVRSGLAAHGFQYVNVDDAWEGLRDEKGEVTTNDRFPDMKALADYVHGKGLKFGIYSSPGPKTCGGYTGSYQHEAQDAQTYAKWGVDYLKYDWCSYGDIARDGSLPELKKPYQVMRQALDGSGRDILFSLCQYGMGSVWEWGTEVGGNCWRTTGDINDSWNSLHGIYPSQNGHEKFAGPGHWNDPDMLVVGRVGWGDPHPSHLLPNEQILHMSLWCLLSSPLLIGCDMEKLDPFTLALLSNDEALEINQDPLGRPARMLSEAEGREVWARPLFDHTVAVGLINSGIDPQIIAVRWADLGLRGAHRVRDLWLHQDLGRLPEGCAVAVPAHGAVLLKVGP